MFRVAIRLVADTALVAILLFTSAGSLAWWRAWVLLAVLLLVRSLGALAAYRVNPALLRERAGRPIHGDQAWTDRLLLLAVLTTGFIGMPVIAGLDVFHWQVLPRPTPLFGDIGLVLFALGWCIKNLALKSNAFAVAVVRGALCRHTGLAHGDPAPSRGALPASRIVGLQRLRVAGAISTDPGRLVMAV